MTRSHGSAIVHLDQNITLDPPNEKGHSVFTPEEASVSLGFLRPDTRYQVETGNASFAFETEPSPWNWSTDPIIYPGVRYNMDDIHPLGYEYTSYCTLAFILRDVTNETLYAMVADHCVTHTEHIYIDDEPVGTVAAREPASGVSNDWAIVQIHDEMRNQTSPLLAYWSGPTTPAQSVPVGDTICFYGHGFGPYPFGSDHPLEDGSPRCGHLVETFTGERTYEATGPSGWWGDSGSPVIHHATGAAFGMATSAWPGVKFVGPKVCHVLDSAREQGFDLVVATAPYQQAEPAVVPHSFGDGSGVEGCR